MSIRHLGSVESEFGKPEPEAEPELETSRAPALKFADHDVQRTLPFRMVDAQHRRRESEDSSTTKEEAHHGRSACKLSPST